MKKLVIVAAMAASIGGFAISANQASAAVSPLNPIAVEKIDTATKVAAKTDGSFQIARRGGGGGFRGGGRGFRHGGRHFGHRGHRGHRWHGYRHVYYGGCFVRKVWTDFGPVYRRICRW